MEYYYPNELYHYGIKGMKWGVRRYQKKDGTLTSAGKKRYSEKEGSKDPEDDNSQSGKKEKRKLTRKQKAIMIGAAVVAAYATYKFVDSGSATRLIAKGKAALGHADDFGLKKNSMLANKDMSADDILSSVVKRINPDYGGIGTKQNCRRCTFAYELSRRGYDVKATKSLTATGQTPIGVASALSTTGKTGFANYWKVADDKESVIGKMVYQGGGLGSTPVKKSDGDKSFSESIFRTLADFKNGSRGELTVEWSVGGAGHSMAWEIIKGKPVVFDCQTGTKYDTPEAFETLGQYVKKAGATRLDNLDLNNDFLLRWVTNA